jgi:uncharacterized phage protein gp47/JayE
MASFLTDFDTLMENILTDYSNLDPTPDTSEGTMVYIKAACLASMLWGLYRYQDYTAKQVFPDTADTDSLNHWGSVYGIARQTDETDSVYAARILNYLQTPPEGGTANDYQTWALSVTSTINAQEDFVPAAVNTATNQITTTETWVQDSAIFPNIVTFVTAGTLPSGLSLATNYYVNYVDATHITVSASSGGSVVPLGTQGTGTHTIVPATTPLYHAETVSVITPMSTLTPTQPGYVSIVVNPDTVGNTLDAGDKAAFLAGAGMTTLLNAIQAYIETVRPVTAAGTTVQPTSELSTGIDITVTPSTLSLNQLNTISADITAFMETLVPGQILYLAKLGAICVNDGAINATVNTPVDDLVPSNYQTIVLAGSPSIHF